MVRDLLLSSLCNKFQPKLIYPIFYERSLCIYLFNINVFQYGKFNSRLFSSRFILMDKYPPNGFSHWYAAWQRSKSHGLELDGRQYVRWCRCRAATHTHTHTMRLIYVFTHCYIGFHIFRTNWDFVLNADKRINPTNCITIDR